ncbi:unnamed protein product [Ectocarpus sp. 4 AP-2014]
MAVNSTLQPASTSSLALSAGLTSLVAMLAYRIGVIERRRHPSGARWRPSKRSAELTRGGTPAHILEHIARIGDPDYICLSIAENKLTVGPLLDKLREFSVTAAQFRGVGEPPRQRRASITTAVTSDNNRGLNVAGDSSDVDSAEEGAALGAVATATTPPARPVDISPADISTAAAVVASPMVMGEPAHSTISSTSTAVAPSSHRLASMGYGEVRGPLWVRREIAEMMGRRMFHRDDVDPDNVVIAAGATSVLRLLVVALTEEGEGCLIPGPYFPGFDKVLNIAGVRAWVANRDPAEGGGGVEGGVDDGISPRVLETALRRARSSGVEIRVLLITSPHNPTGRMYSPKALLAAVSWGRRRGLQIVVDEVYANCIHRPNASFRSVGSLLMADGAAGMGGDVHVLYGLSKDLGVAGWRVGVLYSENKEVVAMVSKMAHASQASSDTMDLVGRLFREPSFLDDYFTQHQASRPRLRQKLAYMSLVNQLGRKGIMYQQAEAGLFIMLDLREYLEDSSKEAEERLWRQMLERTKVNLTPGGAFHCVEPGWFRLCFAYQVVPGWRVWRALQSSFVFSFVFFCPLVGADWISEENSSPTTLPPFLSSFGCAKNLP